MKRSCLSPDEIRMALQGRLPEQEFDSAISHLDQCDGCRSAAETFQRGDDSTDESIGAGFAEPDPIQNETACQIALQRVMQRPAPSSLASVPFDALGPYQLLELIGSGGMGAVYRAQHQRLKRQCAIKLLPPERVSLAGWLDRFDREMTTIASLEHPNVVRATDAGHQSGWHYLVMEHLDGLDVGRVAGRMGQLGVSDACEIVRQAALGLAHIHDSGLVHRDIKPSNLMLTRQGHVKILDLGLVLDGDDPLSIDERLTTVGHVMGTMPYMAPEQLADSRDVRPQSDIYSLGATLYRLIVGHPPHRSGRGLAAQAIAITSTDAAPLDSIREDIDRPLVELVTEMLSRDPSQRPQTAGEVAIALESFTGDAQLKMLAREAARRSDDDPLPLTTHLPSVNHANRGSGVSVKDWLVGMGAAAFLLLATIVIQIQTDRGVLVIHSEQDGLNVLVKQDDEIVERIEVETGDDNRVRLRKGSYHVEIEGAGSPLVLSEEVVTIRRDKDATVNVLDPTQVDPSEVADRQPIGEFTPDGSASGASASGLGAAEPLKQEIGPMMFDPNLPPTDDSAARAIVLLGHDPDYNGQFLSAWVKVVEEDTNIDRVGEAMHACVQAIDQARSFTSTARYSQIVTRAILKRARQLGGVSSQVPPLMASESGKHTAPEHFTWYLEQVFPDPDLVVWFDAFAEELTDGNGRSRATSLHLLRNYLAVGAGSRRDLDSISKFTKSRIMRAAVSLAVAPNSDPNWGDLTEAERVTAAENAYGVVVLLGQSTGFDPRTVPEFVQLIKDRPEAGLSDVERVWKLLVMQEESLNAMHPGRSRGSGPPVLMGGNFRAPYRKPSQDDSQGTRQNVKPKSPVSQPVYQGKTLSEWMGAIERERDVATLAEVMKAVEFLSRDADEETRQQAASSTAKLARLYGGIVAGSREDTNPSHRFMALFLETFPRYVPGAGVAAVAQELSEGNEKSKMAATWALYKGLEPTGSDGFLPDTPARLEQWAGNVRREEALLNTHLALRDQLLELADQWTSPSTHVNDLLRNSAAQISAQCALRLTLLLGQSVTEDDRLIKHAIVDFDRSIDALNTNPFERSIDEGDLFALMSIAKVHPERITPEMHDQVAKVLLAEFYEMETERTGEIFAVLKSNAPKALLKQIDDRLRRPAVDNFTGEPIQYDVLLFALPYYAAQVDHPATGLQAVNAFRGKTKALSERLQAVLRDVTRVLNERADALPQS